MSEAKLTAEKLDEYEAEVAGNERVGLTASRVDNADLLSLIAAARELEAAKAQAWDEGRVAGSSYGLAAVNPYRQPKGPTK